MLVLCLWVTASRENRRVPWTNIPSILGWNVSFYAIRTAFKKEGFTRGLARRKKALTYANRISRLQWAIEHEDWTEDQWFSVYWSDESWVKPGKHIPDWVTRLVGNTELYQPDCIEYRYQRRSGGCSGVQYQGNTAGIRGSFGRKIGRRLLRNHYPESSRDFRRIS